MVEDNDLRLSRVFRIAPDEDVARVRIAVNESSDKDLFGECPNHIFYYLILVKSVPLDLLCISNLDSIDPLSNEDAFSSELIVDFGHADIISPQIAKSLVGKFGVLSLYGKVNFLLEVPVNWLSELSQR